jgi:hypothetical protein
MYTDHKTQAMFAHFSDHSHFDPALFGKTESNSTQTGKWLGACPADMKPGDMLSPNGVKINLNAVLESKPQ